MRGVNHGYRRLAIGVALLAAFAGMAPRHAAADITAEDAQESIRRGVEWLKAQQKPQGNWSTHGVYVGGATSLCTLALLNAGVPVEDPHIQKALDYLRGIGNPKKVYSTALQTMVFSTAEPKKDRLLIS